MATSVMTIDSDSETERPAQKKGKQPKIVAEDDEELFLGHTVILNGDKEDSKQQAQVKVGSSTQWKFTDVLQVDAHKKEQEMDFDTGNIDDRPPFMIPMSERCEEKMKAKGVKLPDFLQ
jgi:hypothetical protein